MNKDSLKPYFAIYITVHSTYDRPGFYVHFYLYEST